MHDEDEIKHRQTEMLFDKAIALYQEFKCKEAAKCFQLLLDDYSDYVDEWNIHEWLGMCYNYIEDFQQAIDYLLKAHKSRDAKRSGLDYIQILQHLGYANFNLDRYHESISYYNAAEDYLKYYSGDNWTNNRYFFHLGKGRCYLYLKEPDSAIREFKKAVEELRLIESKTEGLFRMNLLNYELARTYIIKEDIANASVYLNKVDPNLLDSSHTSSYYYYLGDLHRLDKNYDAALEAFKKHESFGISKGDEAKVFAKIGIVSYFCHKYNEAKEYFAKAIKTPTKDDWVKEKSEEFLRAMKNEENEG